MGFVNPETVKLTAALVFKVPDSNVTVSTNPASDALPVAPNGATNETTGAGEVASVNPDPASVMTTLPPACNAVAGVSATFMVTDVAAALTLLRVMAG